MFEAADPARRAALQGSSDWSEVSFRRDLTRIVREYEATGPMPCIHADAKVELKVTILASIQGNTVQNQSVLVTGAAFDKDYKVTTHYIYGLISPGAHGNSASFQLKAEPLAGQQDPLDLAARIDALAYTAQGTFQTPALKVLHHNSQPALKLVQFNVDYFVELTEDVSLALRTVEGKDQTFTSVRGRFSGTLPLPIQRAPQNVAAILSILDTRLDSNQALEGRFTGHGQSENIEHQIVAERASLQATQGARKLDQLAVARILVSHSGVATAQNLRGVWSVPGHPDDPLAIRPGDSYTLFFDQAFFRYLPDWGDESEVIVVFKFQEGGVGDPNQTLTKIVGPMLRQPDGALSQDIGKITYGPKLFEGNSLIVSIQVIEYDAEEREDRTNFIAFLKDAAVSFNLDNPVTQGEIKLAAEIANLLNKFDDNDEVLNYSFELVPAESGVPISKGIPLRVGTYALVKQEVPPYFSRYFPLTRNLANEIAANSDATNACRYFDSPSLIVYLLTTPVDIISMPITFLRTSFIDTPDGESVAELNPFNGGTPELREFYLSEERVIQLDGRTRELTVTVGESQSAASDGEKNTNTAATTPPRQRTYDSKTWITFSIERGRDPTLWTMRARLSDVEKRIQESLRKVEPAEILDSKALTENIEALQNARTEAARLQRERKEQQMREALKLVAPAP